MTNLDIIKAYQDTIWSQQDIRAIDQYFDKAAIIHSPLESTQGTDKMKTVIAQWHKGFPDLNVTWDDFICDTNKVVSRWHATGTHNGEFLGVAPTHTQVHYAGVTLYRLSNQKIVEYWAYVDMYHLLKMLNDQSI